MLEPIPFAGFVEIPDELTDEEIKELWKPLPNTKVYDSDVLKFARAILRKAQDK